MTKLAISVTTVLLLSLLVSGCAFTPKTGDPLIDEVVRREGGFSTPCVSFTKSGQVYRADPSGPPGMLEPQKLRNPEARAAAEKIAVGWQSHSQDDAFQTIGLVPHDRCLMFVGGPATSGAFAFLTYSDPGGERGAYVFRRKSGNWHVVEKVQLGFW